MRENGEKETGFYTHNNVAVSANEKESNEKKKESIHSFTHLLIHMYSDTSMLSIPVS